MDLGNRTLLETDTVLFSNSSLIVIAILSATVAPPDTNNFTQEELAYQQGDIEFQEFLRLKDSIEYPALVICCILGVIGSFFTLGTMAFNESFSEPVFICYEAIAVFEIFIAFGFGFNAFYKLWSGMRIYYAWNWMEEIAVRFALDPFRETVSVLTMHLSVGRIVAAFLPTKYEALNSPTISYAVTFSSLLIFIAVDLPHISFTRVVWNSGANAYAMSSVGKLVDVSTAIKNALWITLSAGLLVGTVFAVAAFLKAITLRKRLFKKQSGTGTGILFENDRTSGNSPLDAVKKNLQLCYLQLCLTVPLIFYNGLFFILKWWKDDEIAAQKRVGNFSWAYQQAWLLLFLYTAEAVAHFFHFYLYLIFSETFRMEFLKRFCRRK